MVIVIEFMYLKEEYDPITYNTVHKKGDKVVSHGYDTETGDLVVLPNDDFYPFVQRNCYFHEGMGEYILRD